MLQVLKRSNAVLLIALACLTLLLAGCGGKETANQGSTTAPSPSPNSTEEATAAATRLITDDLGRELKVPTAPKRIVAAEFSSELLALGIKPIGAGDNSFKIVYTFDEMNDVARIGDPPSSEVIVELAPDLVVAPTVFLDIYPEQMEQIEKISPVYYISFEQDPIYGIFTKLANLVGKDQEANAWIKEYEQEAATARAALKDALGEETVTIFRVEKGRLRIYLNRNFAGYMLHSSLQASSPEAVAAEIEKNPFGSAIEISLEMLPNYAADHILLIVRDEGEDQDAFEEIEQLELWKSLPAVQNGHVYKLETDKYYGSDIITIRETMKETAAMLVEGAKQP
ncbi:ABC transporter substrate-binding protein [Paenibacillus montaniterrae]|uniref:ABC transporter substrate-binding protein n=1 Tax=Paenibacillus montaniterrae TaxID=429341 RepID=UPI001BCA7736|nr:ABC transporter substrate-binding protein [Paenibacillus montaniterrae]